MHTKNRTQYKTLDRIAADHRVSSIEQVGPRSIWVYLAPGYSDPYTGTDTIHVTGTRAPVKETVARWKQFCTRSQEISAEEARRKWVQLTREEWLIIISFIRAPFEGDRERVRPSALNDLTLSLLQHVPIDQHVQMTGAINARINDMLNPGMDTPYRVIDMRDDLNRDILRYLVTRSYYMRQIDAASERGDISSSHALDALLKTSSIVHKLAEHGIDARFSRLGESPDLGGYPYKS